MTVKKLSTFKIAAAYIGTVVGAGFASGQEVLQFFGYFGYPGLAALVLATLLFIYFGYLILKLGHELKADSHLPLIRYAGGKWAGAFVDYVITFFLFGALTVMAAGAGALFSEQLGLSKLLGSLILIITSLGTVLLGLNGVISAISFMVPVLLATVVYVGFSTLWTMGLHPGVSAAAVKAGNPAVPFWPLSAVVYISYNLVLAVAVLAPLGKEAGSIADVKKGALWGGLGLGVGAALIFLSMMAYMPKAAGFEIPMIYVAGQITPTARIFFALVLYMEIYTTAVGSLYGFAVRFTKPGSARLKIVAALASGGALLAARFGFTALVRVLFPLVGYAGLLMLGGLVYHQAMPYLKGQFKFNLPVPAQKLKPGGKDPKDPVE